MQAAAILLSLSRGGSNHTAIAQPQPQPQYGNDQGSRDRLESISLTGEGGFGCTNLSETNSAFLPPLHSNPMAELVERLRNISFAQISHTLAEHDPQQTSFGTLSSPPVIHYYRCSEVPEEVGRFIDIWNFRGYTSEGILNMLLLNNVIIPHECLYGRLAYTPSNSESYLRSTFGEDWTTHAGATTSHQLRHNREDEETEEEGGDEGSMQSWEDQVEQWRERH